MNARIGFKPQVTATMGFHSLYDWCFQRVWLLSDTPENPADDTVLEKHGAEELYSAEKSLIHAIRTEHEEAQQGVTLRMIQIAMPWSFRRWLESKLAKGQPLVQIPQEYAHRIDLEWTEIAQEDLKTLGERYTSRGASEAWRVHRWWLA
jgi:hypothetical protein